MRESNMKVRTRGLWAAMFAVAVFGVAGCGSDDQSSGGSSGSSGGSSSSSSTTDVKVEGVNTPPTEIQVSEPLKSKPPKKSVAILQCDLPACALNTVGFVDAAKALGWDNKVLTYKSASPGPAVQSAIDAGVDYILLTGVPKELYQPQLDAAKAKGIPVLVGASADKAEDDKNGIYMSVANNDAIVNQSKDLAHQMIADSSGKAHAVIVVTRDYPQVALEEKVITDTIKAECPDCSAEGLPITVDDIGKGAVAQKVVSYLQQNPDTNYVEFGFSDIATGVPQAVAAAGMDDKVKLMGLQFSKAVLQDIIDGKQYAWTALSTQYLGWIMMDGAARLSVDQEIPPESKNAATPTWLLVGDAPGGQDVAKKILAEGGDWHGPEGYQDQFKKLWQVSN